MAAQRSARRWLAARRPALESLAESAGALDHEDVERLLALPLPAIDEFAGLLGLSRWVAAGYERVVVDTAPSGHFLELVRTPGLLADLAESFDTARAEARIVRARLSGRSSRDASDRFIDELDRLARGLASLLRDPSRTTVRWVLVPESMSLDETRDGIAALVDAGLTVEEIIVNRWPQRRARTRAGERQRRRVLATLARESPEIPLRLLPSLEEEPRGRAALLSFGQLLVTPTRPARRSPGPAERREDKPRPRVPGFGIAAMAQVFSAEVRLLLVTGKGGVGKTTSAAALALVAASAQGAATLRPVRLISVDPAHSLADVLRLPLDDRWRIVPPIVAKSDTGRRARRQRADLRARELSADATWRRWRRQLDAVLARDPAAAAAWSELLGTPEGFPEIAAAFEIAATLDAHPEALLIVDCPPTGHALRLIAAPALAVEWIHAGLSTLLKYRQIAPLGPFADWLLHLAQSLTRLRDLLRDRAASATVVVTRPGAVVEAETRRLLRRLQREATPAAALITIQPRRRRAADMPETTARRSTAMEPCAIIAAPACDPPPLGSAELLDWVETWNAPAQ